MSPPESCHGLSSLLQAPKHSLALRRRCISRAASALHFAIVESIPAKPSFSGASQRSTRSCPGTAKYFSTSISSLWWGCPIRPMPCALHQRRVCRSRPRPRAAKAACDTAVYRRFLCRQTGGEVGGVAARTAENLAKPCVHGNIPLTLRPKILGSSVKKPMIAAPKYSFSSR